MKLDLKALERERSDKNYARSQVSIAVKNNTLKKEACACGEKKVEAHHVDYSKPLEVIWCCKKHHIELDHMRKELEVEEKFGLRL